MTVRVREPKLDGVIALRIRNPSGKYSAGICPDGRKLLMRGEFYAKFGGRE
jgi:hypothetical protein